MCIFACLCMDRLTEARQIDRYTDRLMVRYDRLMDPQMVR